MSEEETPQEETVPEEVTTEETETTEVVEDTPPKPECVTIPENMKPLFDCCEKYEKGEIDEATLFGKTLESLGKFMQGVKKPKEGE